MKKTLICFLIFLIVFGIGVLWNKALFETPKISKNTSSNNTNKEINFSNTNYVLYKLKDKTLKVNHLTTKIEGNYDVFVQLDNGKKSKLYDGTRKIVKSGENYMLKVKSIPSSNNGTSINEYIHLQLIENLAKEKNIKLILLKNENIQTK